MRNTIVVRADLKDEGNVVFLIESGRLFHNIGAEKEKAGLPYVTELTVGTVKSLNKGVVFKNKGKKSPVLWLTVSTTGNETRQSRYNWKKQGNTIPKGMIISLTACLPHKLTSIAALSHLLPLSPLAEKTLFPLIMTFNVAMSAPYMW